MQDELNLKKDKINKKEWTTQSHCSPELIYKISSYLDKKFKDNKVKNIINKMGRDN